jgi:hypothetical protein
MRSSVTLDCCLAVLSCVGIAASAQWIDGYWKLLPIVLLVVFIKTVMDRLMKDYQASGCSLLIIWLAAIWSIIILLFIRPEQMEVFWEVFLLCVFTMSFPFCRR